MLPVFEFGDLQFCRQPDSFSRFLQPDVLFLPSGRVALYYALKLLQLSSKSEVLIPAYHCGSMVEPVIYLGAKPKLFPLNPRLQVETQALLPLITPNTRALLLPHFFGFPQDLQAIKTFCAEHNIALIEDCAHCFFSQAHPLGVGSVGDFSITSTVKFFPGVEGGALACNNPIYDFLQLDRQPPSLGVQLKNLLHTLELSSGYGRLGWLGHLLNRRNAQPVKTTVPEYTCSDSSRTRTLDRNSLQWFTPSQIGKDATFATRLIARRSPMQAIIDNRRNNYLRYLDAFAATGAVRPLHEQLDSQVVPYIFPLLLEDPEQHFAPLKRAGVPMWRWEELITSDCPVSSDYRLRLLQLPCHQSLNSNELDWIINTVLSQVGG